MTKIEENSTFMCVCVCICFFFFFFFFFFKEEIFKIVFLKTRDFASDKGKKVDIKRNFDSIVIKTMLRSQKGEKKSEERKLKGGKKNKGKR